MNGTHTESWPQFIHTSTTWRCIFPHDNLQSSFQTVDELYSHLETSHREGFSSEELLTLARKSKALKPRAPNICPFCNEDITNPSILGKLTELAESASSVGSENNLSGQINSRRVQFTDNVSPGGHNDEPASQASGPQLARPSEFPTEPAALRMRMARHVATHLKCLSSFFSLRELETDDEDNSVASNSAVQGFNEGASAIDSGCKESIYLNRDNMITFGDISEENVVVEEEEDRQNREDSLSHERPHDEPEWGFMVRKSHSKMTKAEILR